MNFDRINSCERMMGFIYKVNPLQRMINSDGLDQSFQIMKDEIPGTIVHEYPAGMACDDWIVPKSWKVKTAFLKNENGEIIASFAENPLFVAAYSEPIDVFLTKEEISWHVRCHPTKPGSYFLEHRNAYNYKLVDWGITLPKNLWDNLPDEKYHIFIDIEWGNGSMKVGEVFVQGETDEIISISAHIDELCNDNLSGCVVGMELIRYIQHLPLRKYSYQLLLVPETIGTFFYVHQNLDRVKKTIAMYNLETVGSGENWILKKAFTPNSFIETALKSALNNSGEIYKEIDFFEGYGNDERVYEWPTLGIPGVALQRYPFYEYHSGDDVPENINQELLYKAVQISIELVTVLETDYVPQYTSVIPPWLSRHDLYYDSKDDTSKFHKFNNLVLFNINGKKKISEIALLAGLNFSEVYDYLEKFVDKDFIRKV